MIKTISMKHEVRKVENSSSDFIYGHILKWRLMEWSGVGSQSEKPSVMMGRRDVGGRKESDVRVVHREYIKSQSQSQMSRATSSRWLKG